ncbi:MAG: hypothetical protein LBV51_01400 [Acholeplasmatales bacterium]|jgi:Ca2+/Na+ antiporter|nr:hypothetical protein [Acholeplasmatales bacterium]
MELIAKRQSFSQKRSTATTVFYFIMGIFLVLLGIIFIVIGGIYKYPAIVFIVLGVVFLLIGLYYRSKVKKVLKGPTELIFYDEKTGLLELYPNNSPKVTQNIKNLKNITSVLGRSRYVVYSFGTLTLDFGNSKYVFNLVENLHETSTKLTILQQKNK